MANFMSIKQLLKEWMNCMRKAVSKMVKYTTEMQKGNMGEAFLMSLLSKHALVHRIIGSNDIGIDFLCEWVHQETASGITFAIQVKTTRDEIINIEEKGFNERL